VRSMLLGPLETTEDCLLMRNAFSLGSIGDAPDRLPLRRSKTTFSPLLSSSPPFPPTSRSAEPLLNGHAISSVRSLTTQTTSVLRPTLPPLAR
jgi:hypothetical protein